MVLTKKHKDELNAAIADYMRSSGYDASLAEFTREAGVELGEAPTNLMEKKWTSVVRLQKKIMELEAKVEQLGQDLAERGGKKSGKMNSDCLPKSVARHELSGFRGTVTDVRFHPVVAVVAATGEDGTVKVWDYESGEFEKSLRGHTDSVQCLAFDPSGNSMASCSADLSVKLWDFTTYECTKTLQGHEHNVSGVCFIPPNGDYLASCSRDQSIKIWEAATGYCVKTITGHDDWVRKVIASPDGACLASCSNDQTVRVWDVATGKCEAELREHTHVVESITFADEAACAAITASLGESGTLGSGQIVEGDASQKEKESGGEKTTGYIVSGSRDKTVKLWSMASYQCVHTFVGHDNWVRSVGFHSSGKFVLSVSDDKSVKIWSIGLARCVKTLSTAHPHFVTCVDFNRKYPLMASGSADQKIKIWECS